ncbi:unnamed protein product [Urochloa humidicola]
MALVQDVKMTVPAGEPAAVAAQSVPAAAGDDALAGSGAVIGPPPREHGREEEDAVLGELEDADLTDDDFSDEDDDDDDTDNEYGDSDSEFKDDDGHGAVAASEAAVGFVRFLGQPARFAIVESTAAFMRLGAVEAPAPDHGGEILVHYRYTRFLRGGSGGGVEAHAKGPKQARVRFRHLPSHAAAEPASSLHLAGAAVAPLLYPARFRAQLRALWSGLVAMAPVHALPRDRTRLKVAVDVGILRPGDRTAARMGSMFAAMESVACERLAVVFDAGAELRLPAPLASEDDVRPAKRRRVTGEDCPICCEALEQGLAAWPRCSHIFHASCLGEHLVRGHQECPMCRSGLQVDMMPQAVSEV